MEKDIKIIVASHKKYNMPENDMYLPLQVGSRGKEDLGYARDDVGENISSKNQHFCELTGLYWAWKNLENDYIGLVHYRRYFASKKKSKNKFDAILTQKEAETYLDDYDIIVPKKRKYYIETIESHYKHTMMGETLDEAVKIVDEKYPEYAESFNKVLNRTYMYAFNMFIMKKQYLDEYCTWLFDILFELEERMKYKEYDAFHSRFYGRVSERLFNVWLDYKGYTCKEIPYMYMEKIDWYKKCSGFLKAKFFKKKYDKSF